MYQIKLLPNYKLSKIVKDHVDTSFRLPRLADIKITKFVNYEGFVVNTTYWAPYGHSWKIFNYMKLFERSKIAGPNSFGNHY